MSMGTIVTIVLSISLLVVGIFFISQIGKVSKGVIDLTEEQLRDQINKLFSEESKLAVYPGTRFVEIKQETTDGAGFGIRNLLTGQAGTKTFSYEVVVADSDADLNTKCGINKQIALGWIVTGKSETSIPIASGDYSVQKVLFEIPVGSPLCTIRYRVNVKADTSAYATDFFDVKIKAK